MVEPEEDNDASQDMNAMKRSQLALNKNILEINDLRHLMNASRERQVSSLIYAGEQCLHMLETLQSPIPFCIFCPYLPERYEAHVEKEAAC